ncbi:hypothetical protein E2C01_052051 [Portunus trituberculatus]|uniref:Uncharacterized protein n=1 Tax=Portunus trituberculatus TaxID=210409 RepID=A0A5B7GM13_PORTR|nr:hypothetical protein [Portunus trituberculatus]
MTCNTTTAATTSNTVHQEHKGNATPPLQITQYTAHYHHTPGERWKKQKHATEPHGEDPSQIVYRHKTPTRTEAEEDPRASYLLFNSDNTREQ